MDAPQSREEIEPIVEALRGLDSRLDVIWNPRAMIVHPGRRDAAGHSIPTSYDGRWEVIVWGAESSLHLERGYAVVYQVRWDGAGKEAYRPVGWWLVDFMQKWDASQRDYRERIEKMWKEDAARQESEVNDAQAGFAESLDRVHFEGVYAGGVGNWQGRGADFKEMARAAQRALAPPSGSPALIPQQR